MRLFPVFLIFFTFIGWSSLSLAAGDACEKARSSADVMKCLTRQLDAAQETLNSVFDDLSMQNSGEDLVEIKDIQADWLSYRERECALETGDLETESLKRLENLRCLNRLTQARIETLQRSLKTQDDFEALGEAAAPPRWMNALANDHPDVFWAYGAQIEGDLDCDGESEHIMSGLRSSEDFMEVFPVVSISENPLTGRPKSTVIELGFDDDSDNVDEERVGCGLIARLSFAQPPDEAQLPEDKSGEGQVPDADASAACINRLTITAKACEQSRTLYWTGNEYAFAE
ncbi:MAG: DUF1311 domain-containing protein [Alphaproteobacteria bacterium]|nr:DUF1311 domain-containing protein [Alphaproteobacteria bacterium]